jgi:CRP/FNR family cyclic AMP-dependent transcriptional regulator
MALVPDNAAFQRKLAELPLAAYHAGDTVLTDGSTTGRLFILKKGAVAIIKDGVEIGKVSEPGAVFGELSALLNSPHTADVVAVEASQFHVADGASEFMRDPATLFYVATLLARRLDRANRALIHVKHLVQAGEPRAIIGTTVHQIARLLSASGVTIQ